MDVCLIKHMKMIHAGEHGGLFTNGMNADQNEDWEHEQRAVIYKAFYREFLQDHLSDLCSVLCISFVGVQIHHGIRYLSTTHKNNIK